MLITLFNMVSVVSLIGLVWCFFEIRKINKKEKEKNK